MLRPYQQLALDLIRKEYASGNKKVLLHLATGGGKTVIFSEILKQASAKNKKSMMVVRGRKLVSQASERLIREKVDHGVRMAGHHHINYQAPVQICSIDTLTSRQNWPEADIIVIDEGDQATSDSYIELSKKYPDAYYLPVTATPYTNKPLTHIAHKVIHPVSIEELIALGHLVPPKYYAPSEPDLSDVRVSNGEYVNYQLEEKMRTLTGNIVEHWKRYGSGRPTILFAVNINHSRMLCDQFTSAGVNAEHCDADTPDEEREAILKRSESGETSIICNVGILCRGVDMPWISCIAMARPTKSYNLYIQQAGRGTRPGLHKHNFILLDHAGNIKRHGYITTEPPAALDGVIKKPKGFRIKLCKICYLAYQESDCPDCGPQEANACNKAIEVEEGQLKELVVKEADPVLQFIFLARKTAKAKGYKQGWVWFRLVERFGMGVAEPYLPFWFKNQGSVYRGLHESKEVADN